MIIALLGATGRTGRFVLRELLARGHQVRVLVRSPHKLAAVDQQRVVVILGNASDPQAVHRTVVGTDAVISTLGVARGSLPTIVSRAVSAIVSALQQHRTQRVVVLTGAGARLPGEQGTWWEDAVRWWLSIVAAGRLRDGQRMLDALRRCDVAWTVVRTQLQTDRVLPGALQVGHVGDPQVGWRVARSDLARFLVDCVEDGTYVHQAPVVWTGRGQAAPPCLS